MDMKCVLLLSIILFCVRAQDADNEGETCYQVYVCCRKENTDCLEYCGPTIECNKNSEDSDQEVRSTEATEIETTPPSEGIEETTFQKPLVQNVIAVGACRLGFKADSKGRCRKKL